MDQFYILYDRCIFVYCPDSIDDFYCVTECCEHVYFHGISKVVTPPIAIEGSTYKPRVDTTIQYHVKERHKYSCGSHAFLRCFYGGSYRRFYPQSSVIAALDGVFPYVQDTERDRFCIKNVNNHWVEYCDDELPYCNEEPVLRMENRRFFGMVKTKDYYTPRFTHPLPTGFGHVFSSR